MGLALSFAAALCFCLALSFLCSGMEAGVFALNRLRVRQYMRAGRKRAQLLLRYLENPENFLWTILIGNSVANFLALSMAAYALYTAFGERPLVFWMFFAALIFLFYALCDLLPKILFRMYPNRLCMAMAVPFRAIHLALSPLVKGMAWFSHGLLRLTGGRIYTGHLFGSRSELRSLMQESGQSLSSEERLMISRVLDLQTVTVRSLTLPWNRLRSASLDTPLPEVLEKFRQQPISRMPVWSMEGDVRRTIGVLSLDTIMFATGAELSKKARDFLTPALYLNEDVVLEEALSRLQRKGQRLAVVVGLDGQELGIVTLQDILKFIFGEVTL